MTRSSRPELVGTVVDDRYRVVGLLGSGSSTEVFDVVHVGLGRRMALKVLRPNLVGDATALERVRREARYAARVVHPGLVEVVDLGELPDGAPYLLLERLDGLDLQRTLDSLSEPFSMCRAAAIVRQSAEALAAAHAIGVVHRDVKPANVFLCADHRQRDLVKVLDLGAALWSTVARAMDEESRLTTTGTIVGTPLYMSPEQMWGDRELSGKSDVWSLGVILFELIAGKSPFSARDGIATVSHRIAFGSAPLPRSINPAIPASLERVVVHSLRKEPERRPSAAELALRLGDIEARLSGSSASSLG